MRSALTKARIAAVLSPIFHPTPPKASRYCKPTVQKMVYRGHGAKKPILKHCQPPTTQGARPTRDGKANPRSFVVVAALVVFVGPLLSLCIARRGSCHPLKWRTKKSFSAGQAWINSLRGIVAELTSSALHHFVAGLKSGPTKSIERQPTGYNLCCGDHCSDELFHHRACQRGR